MFKYILVICVILVALSASQRERIWEDTAFLRQPYYKRVAASQVEEIARQIEVNVAAGNALPTRVTFPEFLDTRIPDPAKRVDPWGSPYYLIREFSTARVGSAGGDGRIGTEDDIVSRLVQGRLLSDAETAQE